MGKSAPKAPDPVATAQAQAGANRATALTEQQINMIDQVNPWGSVSYSQNGQAFTPSTGIGSERYYYNPVTGEYRSSMPANVGAGSGSSGAPGSLEELLYGSSGNSGGAQDIGDWQQVQGILTPRYTQTTTLSPEQQAIFNASQAAQGNLANIANEQSAFLQDYLNTPFEYTNRDAENWAYDLASPRILQQQGQNEQTLRTQLANKGIREGSAAWNAELARLTNANTDQLNQLALTGRAQGFSEALAQRNQPLNEITALLSGSQVSNPAQMSGATPSTGVGGVDYSGLVQQNYQNQLGAYNSQMGGLGGLFGSVLGAAGQAGGFGALFSDRRLKTDIRRIGSLPSGLPVYAYRYAAGSVADDGGADHVGVMADEAAGIFPASVFMHPSGFAMINYSEIR